MIAATASRAPSMPWPVSMTKSASARFSASGICLARIAANFSSRHARPRQHALALDLRRRGDDHDLVDAVAAAGLEQQRNVEHDQRCAGGAMRRQEGVGVGPHQRMDDRFEPLQRRADRPDTLARKLAAVDDAVVRPFPGKAASTSGAAAPA